MERAKVGLWVLPLHGALSGAEQSLVFRTGLPGGKTKVGSVVLGGFGWVWVGLCWKRCIQ